MQQKFLVRILGILESELETSQTSRNHISTDEVRSVLKKEVDPQLSSNRLISSDRRSKMVKQQSMVKSMDVDLNNEIQDNVENFMR